ncbi:MAG: type IV-A pilus assembly ATPase PilB [Deltaproteobacteria bacterium]|nr:type IV-A pilus assembly ATPase PilB [Deltaproteobacteria bacterium]
MPNQSARPRPVPARASGSKSTSLKATIMDQSGAGRKRIGELLSKEGHITATQLQEALKYQEQHSGRLGGILIRLGYIEEDTIVSVLNRLYNYPAALLSKISPDPKAIETVSYEVAKKYMAFPIRLDGDTLHITMAEPTDATAVEALQNDVHKSLRIYVSTESDIIEAFRTHYKIDDSEYESLKNKKDIEEPEDDNISEIIEVEDFGSLVSEAVGDIELSSPQDEEESIDEFSAVDAPIIKLVNGILIKAVNDGISDIHIEPFEKSLQVRYRLDGSLYKSMNLPLSIRNAMTSRIKILSGMNIAERRVPQDGRIKMRFGRNRTIDFRVSTLPTLHGEGVVMRILDKSALNVDLTKLGFEPKTFEVLKRCIYRPYGLLLVTGPTGSGKTTTLYSILNALNKEDTKILTAEDPVEFNFKGINQVNVKEEVGMTFAAALRAFLRQDPDIIMVGEIRDLETAEIAIKAAMTGHLVFSTLHTNDSPSTIGRLVDIGIPSYMLASSVTMVLSQRLVRKLCSKCKEVVSHHDPQELMNMGFSEEEVSSLKLYGPRGCSECTGTGYKGRVGLYELMAVTEEVAKAINANVPEDQLRRVAIQEGMTTLRDAGLEKIRQGVTSVEEVLKRTTITKDALPSYLLNPEVERYEDREIIIREGNRDKDFFMLVQGALMVVKKGRKIAEIVQPGDYFGEMSAITGEPRSATIISKGRSIIKRFPGDKVFEIIEKYPEVAKQLFVILSDRLRHADNTIVKLLNYPKTASRTASR